MITLEIADLPVDQLPGKAVAALFFADHRPLTGPAALLDWRLDGQVTRLLLEGGLSGKAGEHLMLQNNGKLAADWVLLVGGGSWQGLCRETYAALIAHTVRSALQAGLDDLALCLPPHEEADAGELASMVKAALQREGQAMRACRLSRVPLLG